jgi:hypothetical protein
MKTKAQWDKHNSELAQKYGASPQQFLREGLSVMQCNSTKAYEKFAKRAGIEVKESEEIAYELRLRMAVNTVITMATISSDAEFDSYQDMIINMSVAQYEDRRK